MANERQLPDALRARLLAEVSTEKAPTRRDVQVRRGVAIAACLTAFFPLLLGLRGDFHELPMLYGLGTAILASAAAGSLLAFGLSRGRAMMGPRFGVLLAALLIVPTTVLVFLLAVVRAGPSSPVVPAEQTMRAMLVCDGIAIAIGLPPLFAALAYRRVFSSNAPALVGALLGAAAGLLAHMGVHLHCAVTDTSHIMIGHFLPALPLALVGAWVLSSRR